MTGLLAWWQPDGRPPDLLTTARQVDRLVGLLACQPGGAAARLAPHSAMPAAAGDQLPYRELVVAVGEVDVLGSIGYLTTDGAWYVQGKRRDDGGPIMYPFGQRRLEFPADALIPLQLVGIPIKDFLATSGRRRPPDLTWRPWPAQPPQPAPIGENHRWSPHCPRLLSPTGPPSPRPATL
jgi:hypothetical protein